jgi:thiol-disulfide isomerase/thioredoxin
MNASTPDAAAPPQPKDAGPVAPAANVPSVKKQYSGMSYGARRGWTVPRWMKDAFVVFALCAVAGVVVSKAVQHFGSEAERARTLLEADDLGGKPAAPFTLPARGGGTLDLAQLKGKVVLVNFWASWCEPCRAEEPSMQKLAESFAPGTFALVAVSVDDGWDPVEKFFAGRKPAYQVALDQGAVVSFRYGTHKFPESYLLDPDGRLRLKFVGPRNWTDKSVFTLLEGLGAKPVRGG